MGLETEILFQKKREKRKKRHMNKIRSRSTVFSIITISCLLVLIISNLIAYNYNKKVGQEFNKLWINYQNEIDQHQSTKSKLITAYLGKSDSNNKIKKSSGIDERIDSLKKENDKLRENNKVLTDDNLLLQNSLKLAATVGIKPKNYTIPPEITSRSNIDRKRYLGKFKITAYTPSAKECGNSKGITYSGKPIIPGVSVAVDKRHWPIGTVFYIKGLGYVTAMDTGSAIKGKKRMDFAVLDKKFAFALGTKYWDVYLVRMGNGKVQSIYK